MSYNIVFKLELHEEVSAFNASYHYYKASISTLKKLAQKRNKVQL
jgi:hypothetical protein